MPASEAAMLALAIAAGGAALLLAVGAAVLLGRAAEDRDLAARIRGTVRMAEGGPAPAGAIGRRLLGPVRHVGVLLHRSAIISEEEVAGFRRALAAAGFDPRHAIELFIGLKALLLPTLPMVAGGLTYSLGLERLPAIELIGGALVLAVMGPGWIVGYLRRGFQARLQRGMPDAFDLLVVAAEAGLGLESALDRVAREMAGANPAIAIELNLLVQEMRMLPDRNAALERLGKRAEVPGLKRLATTLSQTLRYGTPLAQALRVLASDLRQERMLRLEEKAVRLPAKLILPLILFILPSLFIVLIGPSIIQMGKTFGGAR